MTAIRTTSLVLLPGMDGTGVLFEPLLECLPPELVAMVVSYPVDMPCGYEELLQLVRAALPKNKPYLLVGESFSGPLAILIARERPPGLLGIVLCASFARSPASWLSRRLSFLVAPTTLAIAPTFLKTRQLLGTLPAPRVRALLSRADTLVTNAVMAARIKAVLHVDVREQMRACPIPVLYLRAEHDRLVPPRCADEIAACKPETLIATIAAPHLLLQTNPTEAIAAIERFVEDSSNRSLPKGKRGDD